MAIKTFFVQSLATWITLWFFSAWIVKVNAQPPCQVLASSNSPRCAGDTLEFSATFLAGASYNWQGPNGFIDTTRSPQIINVQVDRSGIYTLTVSGSGCSPFTTTISVEVNAQPVAKARTNAPICAGDLLLLTADSNPLGTTYFWQGPSGFTSTDQNPFIFGAAPFYSGDFILHVNYKGCQQRDTIKNLIINTPPKAIASSNSPLCVGATLSLVGTEVSSQQPLYAWSGPNNFISTLLSPSIVSVDTIHRGNYKFKVQAPGCKPDSTFITVQVNPLPNPTLANSTVACQGGNLVLSVAAIPNASYLWQLASGKTSSLRVATFANVDSLDAGDATLSVTVPGCSAVTRITTIIINRQHPPLQVRNTGPVCTGKVLQLIGGNSFSGATYQWRGPNNFQSDSINTTINNVSTTYNGVFTLTATVSGCPPTTATTLVQVDSIPNLFPRTNSPVCVGGGLVLSAAFIKNARYTWRTPKNVTYNQLVSVTIPSVVPSDSGVYYVEATLGSCTRRDSVVVSINIPPTNPNPFSNAPICSGDTLKLTVTSFPKASYLWQGPNNFSSTLVSPTIPDVKTLASGTYRVTVTVPACLPVTATTSVVVTQRPNPAITTNSPVCAGNTLQLAVTPIAGATYLWQGPNGFRSVNPTVNRTNATTAFSGLYRVKVSVSGCDTTVSDSVIINPAISRPALASNAPICVGDTLRLTATTNAQSIRWQGPAGFESTENTPQQVTTSTTNGGWYKVIATTPGCASVRDSIWVTVNQIPSFRATSNSPICEGATLNLGATINSIPGARYRWNGPKGFSANSLVTRISNVDTTQAGRYALTITLPGCTATDTINVTISAKPIAPNPGNSGPACQTDSIVTFSAIAIPNATYLWSGPAGFSSTLQNPILRNLNLQKAGIYTLTVTTPFCPPITATTTLVINPSLQGIKTGNNAPLCAGQTLELFATFISGASYTWQGPGGFIATTARATRQDVTPVMAGNYTLTVTIPGCPTFTTVDSNIVINPSANLPNPRNNSPICEGTTLIFTANPTPGANYIWQGPNGFNVTTDVPTYSMSEASLAAVGIYTVSVVLNNCPPVTGTTSVAIRPNQAASATLDFFEKTICGEQDLTLTIFLGGTPPWEIVVAENGIPKIQSTGITASPYQLVVPFPGFGTFNYTLVSVRDAAICSSGTGSVGGFASATFRDATPAQATLSLGENASGCGGGNSSVSLVVNLTGRGPWKFSYQVNGTNTVEVGPINQTPYIFEAPIPNRGTNTYELISLIDGNNCSNTQVRGRVNFEANPDFRLELLEKVDGGCSNGRIIVRGLGGLDNFVTYSIDGLNFTNTNGVFENLAPGIYTVYAKNRNCVVSQNVVIAGVEPPVLNPITNVGENTLLLSWTPTRNAASYTLSYRVVGTSQWLYISDITGTSRLITSGLMPNTRYEFRVQAVCANGVTSVFSNIQQGVPSESGGSGGIGNCATPPTLRLTNRTSTSATLSWLANTSGAVCYVVAFGPANTNPETWSSVFLVQHPTNSVTISGLNPNQNYGVRIRTNCSVCSSRSGTLTTWSAPITFTTLSSRKFDFDTEEENSLIAAIYPNPASTTVTCEVKVAQEEMAHLILADLQGKTLYTEQVYLRAGVNEKSIDLTEISPGLYLLRLVTPSQEYQAKLIVNK
ncbi:MAG: fibronectin type III domain-containing protein [Bacteroidia bacterium]|nr:fibronectin type III domain-containing protein [Bacteroidia bacterium]MDW8157542.1 fibronectin type III domain-containing protein [Bacteroidia bacterium]